MLQTECLHSKIGFDTSLHNLSNFVQQKKRHPKFTAESQVKKLKRLQRGEAFDRMGLGKLRTLKESARAPAGDDFLALGFIKKAKDIQSLKCRAAFFYESKRRPTSVMLECKEVAFSVHICV